ncbi:cytochrome b561 [Caballeronia udeis]|jgi:cytochrome b561|uniref:Cytochrome b561 n=1 Tax=Caballeronia udeis TaxID=1232866 RepID=A0ABW8MRP1_9BURK
MNKHTTHYSFPARSLHWLMAVLIAAMLIIGLDRNLLGLHKPLGILILVLALIRIVVRLKNGTPPLPRDMPGWQRLAASLSHLALYALMVMMPLVGWSMLSAEGYPIVLLGSLHLPPIAPHDMHLYLMLRKAHMFLALLLSGTFLMHASAALFHGLIRRDGVFSSMASGGEAPNVDRPNRGARVT